MTAYAKCTCDLCVGREGVVIPLAAAYDGVKEYRISEYRMKCLYSTMTVHMLYRFFFLVVCSDGKADPGGVTISYSQTAIAG